MKAEYIDGFIIDKSEYGENLLKFSCLSPSGKTLFAYKRLSSKAQPKLFEHQELFLSTPKQGTSYFIKEFKIKQEFSYIPKNYTAYEEASKWCQFLGQNHEIESAFKITQHALNAWNTPDYCPFAVSIKALFVAIKTEGYGVQEWINSLDIEKQRLVSKILKSPLASIEHNILNKSILESLRNWTTKCTDFILI